MNKKRILILLFCIITCASKAQTLISTRNQKLVDSTSLRISLKTYILMETDSFILFTPAKYFMEPYALWIKENPQFHDDKELYQFIEKDTAKKLVKINKIADEYNMADLVKKHIAGCLKIGKCLVYNKISEKLERKITIEDYLVNEHGEIKYIVNGSVLFTMYD